MREPAFEELHAGVLAETGVGASDNTGSAGKGERVGELGRGDEELAVEEGEVGV